MSAKIGDDNNVRKLVVVNAVAGTVQATLVTVVGYPFDFVKGRLQAKLFDTNWSCIRSTYVNEGLHGFYRGSAMPWISHLLKRPIQYPFSEWLKIKSKQYRGDTALTYLDNYAIGVANGVIGPIFGTPLQVVKVSMQTSNASTTGESTAAVAKNSWDYIRGNYRRNGIAGFYRGFWSTMAKDCMFGGSFLGTYYTLRDITNADRWYVNAFNGSAAHCITWLLLIPIDYVKTNVQRSEEKLRVMDVVREGYRRGGIRIFWRGVIPACLRTIPVSGCAMIGYETVRSALTERLN